MTKIVRVLKSSHSLLRFLPESDRFGTLGFVFQESLHICMGWGWGWGWTGSRVFAQAGTSPNMTRNAKGQGRNEAKPKHVSLLCQSQNPGQTLKTPMSLPGRHEWLHKKSPGSWGGVKYHKNWAPKGECLSWENGLLLKVTAVQAQRPECNPQSLHSKQKAKSKVVGRGGLRLLYQCWSVETDGPPWPTS